MTRSPSPCPGLCLFRSQLPEPVHYGTPQAPTARRCVFIVIPEPWKLLVTHPYRDNDEASSAAVNIYPGRWNRKRDRSICHELCPTVASAIWSSSSSDNNNQLVVRGQPTGVEGMKTANSYRQPVSNGLRHLRITWFCCPNLCENLWLCISKHIKRRSFHW